MKMRYWHIIGLCGLLLQPLPSYALSSKSLCDLAKDTGGTCVPLSTDNRDSEEWQNNFANNVLNALLRSVGIEPPPATTQQPKLIVMISGSGSVAGDGINCVSTAENECAQSYDASRIGDVLSLTATASSSNSRAEWGGTCSDGEIKLFNGTATCSVVFNDNPEPRLTIDISGSGTVKTELLTCVGIDSHRCRQLYPINKFGATLNLTATAVDSSAKVVWGSGCEESRVTLSADTFCSVKFELPKAPVQPPGSEPTVPTPEPPEPPVPLPPEPRLTIDISGSGTVETESLTCTGIDKRSCTKLYPSNKLGSTLNLTAKAADSNAKVVWGSGCENARVTLSTNTLCAVQFVVPNPPPPPPEIEPSRFGGISARCLVGSAAENYMYAGFQVSGGAKTVTLGAYKVHQIANNAFVPKIEVKTYPEGKSLYSNVNPNNADTINTTITLLEGWYTVTVSPVSQGGIGIVYVNEVDNKNGYLASISSRCYVSFAPEDAMIAGIEVKGETQQCTAVNAQTVTQIVDNQFLPRLHLQTFPTVEFPEVMDVIVDNNPTASTVVPYIGVFERGAYTSMVRPLNQVGIGIISVSAKERQMCP
jgi:hypothetical protein